MSKPEQPRQTSAERAGRLLRESETSKQASSIRAAAKLAASLRKRNSLFGGAEVGTKLGVN